MPFSMTCAITGVGTSKSVPCIAMSSAAKATLLIVRGKKSSPPREEAGVSSSEVFDLEPKPDPEPEADPEGPERSERLEDSFGPESPASPAEDKNSAARDQRDERVRLQATDLRFPASSYRFHLRHSHAVGRALLAL